MTQPLGKKLEDHVAAVLQLEQGAIVNKNDEFYGGLLADLPDRGWSAVAEYCKERGVFADLAKNQFGWHLRLTRMR
ncbi:MAG: hypothetical protein HS101_16075 [Planctomycetia bacterium]|jgi:hypothetical protein|nr:hypothetical protein [Planctomycetia bacterium]MCC7315135.1 hypothetical protein [Planctomycetota bacterium]OQY96237.1 MAG: hypothetical protein B6D36_19635 [Planctomycetes bacterium UTPLA1]